MRLTQTRALKMGVGGYKPRILAPLEAGKIREAELPCGAPRRDQLAATFTLTGQTSDSTTVRECICLGLITEFVVACCSSKTDAHPSLALLPFLPSQPLSLLPSLPAPASPPPIVSSLLSSSPTSASSSFCSHFLPSSCFSAFRPSFLLPTPVCKTAQVFSVSKLGSILFSPLAGYVSPNKPLCFSESQFSHLRQGQLLGLM